MGAKVEKRPLTDNMERFTDLCCYDTQGELILVSEKEYLFINLNI